jgi:hypothetical protein
VKTICPPALAAWSSDVAYACGAIGREIEYRLGIHRLVALKNR